MTEDGPTAAAPPTTEPPSSSPALPPLPDGVHFAYASPDHIDEIVAHNCAMAKETEDLDLPPAKLHPGVTAAVVQKKAQYFVLHQPDTGRVLAQTMITFEWSDWRNADCWWIQSVYVPPDWRRKGLWRALYARVKEEAVKAGACGLRLYAERANARAQSAYINLGMTSHYVVFEDMFTGY